MSHFPFQDSVAIDTNVFQHLLNPQNNVGSHINKLLDHLIREKATLVVDDQGLIAGEYKQQLKRRLGESNDTRNEIQILRYWILYALRHQISFDDNDELMAAIREVIIEVSENVDRGFVYVAFRWGTTLISNDLRHIVTGPADESQPRRIRLLSSTTVLRPSGAGILTSQEASDKIHQL